MQHEIQTEQPLLDENGCLTEPGYARRMLLRYRRADVKACPAAVKEWDYYYIGNDRFGLALTIDDNGYMGLASVSFLDFSEKWQITKSPVFPLPLGRVGLPERSDRGDSTLREKDYALSFRKCLAARKLTFYMANFRGAAPIQGEIVLTDEPAESMVIATPFDRPGRFYYNQKINCMRASGTVTLGNARYRFDPADSFAVLDWGRGVWTYHNTWYWASLSTELDGVPFGFNLGRGFGNTAAATENMLFYGGRAHKLSQVRFDLPQKLGRDNYMAPWRFFDDSDRLELTFVPVLDRAACTDLAVLKSKQHQVFGRFSGRAVLDDGTELTFRDRMGFAEKVENKW